MSIRTFNGNWIIAGDGIATNDDCCCDGACSGPCDSSEDCAPGCGCVDGECVELETVCCTAFYVPDDYQENKDQFGDGCTEPGFIDVGDGCRYTITLDNNCDECDAVAAWPDAWPPGLTWECVPSSDCSEFIPDDPP